MENKINIAELLKDCPKGMALDCTIWDNVEFDHIEQNSELTYPIHCLMKINGGYNALVFTRNGCNDRHPNAKCVIFPKGKTTWEGFVPPCRFKDGDVLFHSDSASNGIFIFKEILQCGSIQKVICYCDYDSEDGFCLGENHTCCYTDSKILHPATEEQRTFLFRKIKEAGYKWNAETKTLKKLPKFKVGDRIKYRSGEIVYRIVQITEDSYVLDNLCSIPISIEHMYNLVPNKFDINTLNPFDKVLVRNAKTCVWTCDLYSHYSSSNPYNFVCTSNAHQQCIPYNDDTKYLLGTTNDCDEFYKNWK